MLELALQQVVLAHVENAGRPQSKSAAHAQETFAIALLGATSEATTGSAIIDARPIFFITSRRDCPTNLGFSLLSKRLFSFNWSIASQIRSSETSFPDCFSRILAISWIEVLPSHDFQTVA